MLKIIFCRYKEHRMKEKLSCHFLEFLPSIGKFISNVAHVCKIRNQFPPNGINTVLEIYTCTVHLESIEQVFAHAKASPSYAYRVFNTIYRASVDLVVL